MDAKTLGDFIAGRRRELGLTQAQLAARLHLTDKAVSRWERGETIPEAGLVSANWPRKAKFTAPSGTTSGRSPAARGMKKAVI